MIKSNEITIVPISSIKVNSKNRNKHPKEQIDRLAEIMKYQGFRNPLVVSSRSGMLVAGHGRLMAAKKIGMKEVPVIIQYFDSDEQEYAYHVSDNAIASWAELDLSGINFDVPDLGPEFDIDMLGIKDFVLEPSELLEPQCDEDEIPEKVEPRSKPGDIYRLGDHRVMCGDSTSIDAVEKLMNGEKAELCFTSPPYAHQREYRGGKDLSTEHLAKFISTAFGMVSYFAVNLGYARENKEVNCYWDDYIKEAKSCGLKFLSWNIWDKGQAGSIGNQTAMFAITHEWVFVFGHSTKDLNLTVENKHAGDIADHITNRQANGATKGKKKANIIRSHSQMQTILSCYPQKARNHGIDHPAMFPVHFAEEYVLAMTDDSDGIYEPFGGSGSTLIACEKTKRKCYMMEIDPHYVDVIVARWEKYTGKKAELING